MIDGRKRGLYSSLSTVQLSTNRRKLRRHPLHIQHLHPSSRSPLVLFLASISTLSLSLPFLALFLPFLSHYPPLAGLFNHFETCKWIEL